MGEGGVRGCGRDGGCDEEGRGRGVEEGDGVELRALGAGFVEAPVRGGEGGEAVDSSCWVEGGEVPGG